MRKEFIGYYNPTEEEINNAWNNGVFAFDANTLLNLYRYTELTRNDFIASLKSITEKLFLPYQAALEFHSNRLTVIDSIDGAYSKLEDILKENFEKQLMSQFNQYNKHPSIIIDNILKLYTDFLKKVSSELKTQKNKQPDFRTKDNVLDELTELFENRIGKEYSKDGLKKIYLEGKDRYDEQIPPGYKDLDNKKKKGDKHIYGDFIIWKELIDLAKKDKKPIVFVTDDRKEDWWRIENGKSIRAREELIKEFYDLTSIRILIYNADNFLKYAKKRNLIPQIKENTINEIKETRIADENTLQNIKDILKRENTYFHIINNYNRKFKRSDWSPTLNKSTDNYLDNYQAFMNTLSSYDHSYYLEMLKSFEKKRKNENNEDDEMVVCEPK